MNLKMNSLALAIALLLVAGMTGCQTYGESAGLGGLIGAGAGALIGGTTGGEDGALIGAAVGGALGATGGLIVHDVRRSRAEQVKPAQQTAEVYQYKPSYGQSLVFEEANVRPPVANRGQYVKASMQYALLGEPSGTRVTERRVVLQNDQVVSQISAEEHQRNDGTWVSEQEFRIPESWAPGEYVLEQVVSTSRLTVSGRVRLMVQ